MPDSLQTPLENVDTKVYTKSDTIFNIHKMTTQVIGIKNFRENITKLWKEARKKKIRYIVMHHSRPILEVKPITEKELKIAKLKEEVAEARERFKKGEYYTLEEVMEGLGLKPKDVQNKPGSKR